MTELVYVVSCIVTAVHKFYFRLVINGTPNIWRPVFVKLGHTVTQNHVFDRICMSGVDHRREC